LLNKTFLSDCRYFPDIYVSQGSVSTRMMGGGIFNDHFITNLLLSLWVNFEMLKIGQYVAKLWRRVSCIFYSRGILTCARKLAVKPTY